MSSGLVRSASQQNLITNYSRLRTRARIHHKKTKAFHPQAPLKRGVASSRAPMSLCNSPDFARSSRNSLSLTYMISEPLP